MIFGGGSVKVEEPEELKVLVRDFVKELTDAYSI